MSESAALKDSERTPCEIYSRVMGYIRPISCWNIGKKSEWSDRKIYTQPKTDEQNTDGVG